MFVWKSKYDKMKEYAKMYKGKLEALEIEHRSLKIEVIKLQAELQEAQKNDKRDAKGRFVKA